MKRIFIDVTQLMQWQGRLTGVPRVQHELISRFINDKESIFVTWHGYDFCEIEREEILGRDQKTLNADDPSVIAVNRARVQLIRAKHLLGRSMLVRKVYRKLRGIRKNIAPTEPNDGNVIVPTSEDAFFIIEGIWSDENYIQKIISFSDSGTKIVQASHDMLPIVTPQYSGHSTDWLDNYARKIYPICTLILSISQHTRRDIEQWLASQNLYVPPIEVFRLGDNFKLSTPKKPITDGISKQKFVLCVGTIEARKNHTLLYYTYKQAASKGIQLPTMVIVGRRGWRTENVFDLMTTDPDVKDKIVILQNSSDEELSWLYSNCLFTVYPSFYEGWGLPIAESMYYGIPCLASNTSSMPEVAGSLISYFDPTSPDMLLTKMTSLLDPRNLEEARIKAHEYKMTSWDDSYNQAKKYIMGIL